MSISVRRIKDNMRLNLQRNMAYYLVVFFIFLVGVTAGGFSGNTMPSGAKSALQGYIAAAFRESSQSTFMLSSVFFQSLFAHLVLFLLVGLGGVSVFLFPVSMLGLLFRGFLMGFAAVALVAQQGLLGALAALLCVVLPYLILGPCYLYASASGIRCSIEGMRTRTLKSVNRVRLREHVSKSVSAFLVALVGVVLETLVVPLWLKLLASIA